MYGRIKRALCLLMALICMGGTASMAETVYYNENAGEQWYQDMLRDGEMNLGSNLRLKNVIRRAQAGEEITVALIGGSITEGAGASEYKECYAVRFAQGFGKTYGVDGGKNVHLVNAGVGGTPSTFGLMRYEKDVVRRVKDPDGLPDLVVIEFAVNDYEEPSVHRCYESLVKTVLQQPNSPAVILLFSVFPGGFNLQDALKKIGFTYDLMMVSVKNAAYSHVGKQWTEKEFFFDQYHPTSLGHGVMADCLLRAVADANALADSAEDIDLNVAPAYGTDFVGLRTIYAGEDNSDIGLSRGGFVRDDTGSYSNLPVGRVCGMNFFHEIGCVKDPLTFTATFKNLLVAWRATNDSQFGAAVVVVDGQVVKTLKGGEGKWGQSEVVLAFDAKEAAEHTVEIRMADGNYGKRFTVTCIAFTP